MKPDDLILNGRYAGLKSLAISPISAETATNHWASQEYNSGNAWYVNFGNGNVNNNNKYNGYVVRAVVALSEQVKSEWIAAFEDCCHHKLTTHQCTLYRMDFEEDIFVLAAEVYNGTYEIGTSVTFCVEVPKLREIFAADFRDRIVQHWIVQRINPFFEERFRAMGDVSYNCRVGFGTLRAVQRVQEEIIRISENYSRPCYIGIMDIASFFTTIDRDITWQLLEPFIRQNADRILKLYPGTDIDVLIRVTHQTIMHNPQLNCKRQGDVNLWYRLMKENPKKSLFGNDPGKGLPIGNITSQLIANFILSFLDEYLLKICRQCGAIIIRFVDDIAVVALRPEDVVMIRKAAAEYLIIFLHQKLHDYKFYIQEVHKGGKFVGTYIKPGRLYTSDRTLGHFYEKLRVVEELCIDIIEDGISLGRASELEQQIAGVNSYFGFLSHTASYKRKVELFQKLVYFWKVCYLQNGHIAKIRKKYKISTLLIRKEYEEIISNETCHRRTGAESLLPDGEQHQLRHHVQP